MKIPTKDVPQADKIEVVEKALRAVSSGAKTYQEITSVLGYAERQGRYYRRACEILGFTIKVGRNQSVMSPLGSEYLAANANKKKELLGQAILKSDLFQRVIPFFESKTTGVSREELRTFLSQLTEKTTPGMVGRRTSTVLSWLEYAGIIWNQGGIFVLNALPESVKIVNYNNPFEPLLPSHFELTEYEKIERRMSAFQNTTTFEMDRTKRDRANDAHNRLTNLLADKIRKNSGIPRSNVLVDLATQMNGSKYIFEIKSTTIKNARAQVRRGISQLYEYRYLQNAPDAHLVLVIENPLPETLDWYKDYLINDRGIFLVWDGNDMFYCPDYIRDTLEFLAV